MNNKTPKNIVTLILKNIRLENVSNEKIETIKNIGAYEHKISQKIVWVVDYSDDCDLAKKLETLNTNGFLFEGEPAGWPPAEIFDNLRKKGIIKSKFNEIRWRGPGNWFIIER